MSSSNNCNGNMVVISSKTVASKTLPAAVSITTTTPTTPISKLKTILPVSINLTTTAVASVTLSKTTDTTATSTTPVSNLNGSLSSSSGSNQTSTTSFSPPLATFSPGTLVLSELLAAVSPISNTFSSSTPASSSSAASTNPCGIVAPLGSTSVVPTLAHIQTSTSTSNVDQNVGNAEGSSQQNGGQVVQKTSAKLFAIKSPIVASLGPHHLGPLLHHQSSSQSQSAHPPGIIQLTSTTTPPIPITGGAAAGLIVSPTQILGTQKVVSSNSSVTATAVSVPVTATSVSVEQPTTIKLKPPARPRKPRSPPVTVPTFKTVEVPGSTVPVVVLCEPFVRPKKKRVRNRAKKTNTGNDNAGITNNLNINGNVNTSTMANNNSNTGAVMTSQSYLSPQYHQSSSPASISIPMSMSMVNGSNTCPAHSTPVSRSQQAGPLPLGSMIQLTQITNSVSLSTTSTSVSTSSLTSPSASGSSAMFSMTQNMHQLPPPIQARRNPCIGRLRNKNGKFMKSPSEMMATPTSIPTSTNTPTSCSLFAPDSALRQQLLMPTQPLQQIQTATNSSTKPPPRKRSRSKKKPPGEYHLPLKATCHSANCINAPKNIDQQQQLQQQLQYSSNCKQFLAANSNSKVIARSKNGNPGVVFLGTTGKPTGAAGTNGGQCNPTSMANNNFNSGNQKMQIPVCSSFQSTFSIPTTNGPNSSIKSISLVTPNGQNLQLLTTIPVSTTTQPSSSISGQFRLPEAISSPVSSGAPTSGGTVTPIVVNSGANGNGSMANTNIVFGFTPNQVSNQQSLNTNTQSIVNSATVLNSRSSSSAGSNGNNVSIVSVAGGGGNGNISQTSLVPISSSIVNTKNGGQIAVIWMPAGAVGNANGKQPTAFSFGNGLGGQLQLVQIQSPSLLPPTLNSSSGRNGEGNGNRNNTNGNAAQNLPTFALMPPPPVPPPITTTTITENVNLKPVLLKTTSAVGGTKRNFISKTNPNKINKNQATRAFTTSSLTLISKNNNSNSINTTSFINANCGSVSSGFFESSSTFTSSDVKKQCINLLTTSTETAAVLKDGNGLVLPPPALFNYGQQQIKSGNLNKSSTNVLQSTLPATSQAKSVLINPNNSSSSSSLSLPSGVTYSSNSSAIQSQTLKSDFEANEVSKQTNVNKTTIKGDTITVNQISLGGDRIELMFTSNAPPAMGTDLVLTPSPMLMANLMANQEVRVAEKTDPTKVKTETDANLQNDDDVAKNNTDNANIVVTQIPTMISTNDGQNVLHKNENFILRENSQMMMEKSSNETKTSNLSNESSNNIDQQQLSVNIFDPSTISTSFFEPSTNVDVFLNTNTDNNDTSQFINHSFTIATTSTTITTTTSTTSVDELLSSFDPAFQNTINGSGFISSNTGDANLSDLISADSEEFFRRLETAFNNGEVDIGMGDFSMTSTVGVDDVVNEFTNMDLFINSGGDLGTSDALSLDDASLLADFAANGFDNSLLTSNHNYGEGDMITSSLYGTTSPAEASFASASSSSLSSSSSLEPSSLRSSSSLGSSSSFSSSLSRQYSTASAPLPTAGPDNLMFNSTDPMLSSNAFIFSPDSVSSLDNHSILLSDGSASDSLDSAIDSVVNGHRLGPVNCISGVNIGAAGFGNIGGFSGLSGRGGILGVGRSQSFDSTNAYTNVIGGGGLINNNTNFGNNTGQTSDLMSHIAEMGQTSADDELPLCDVDMVNKVLSDLEMEKLDDSLLALASSSTDIYCFGFDQPDQILGMTSTEVAKAPLASTSGKRPFEGDSNFGTTEANNNSTNVNGFTINNNCRNSTAFASTSNSSNVLDTTGSLASLVAQGKLKKPRIKSSKKRATPVSPLSMAILGAIETTTKSLADCGSGGSTPTPTLSGLLMSTGSALGSSVEEGCKTKGEGCLGKGKKTSSGGGKSASKSKKSEEKLGELLDNNNHILLLHTTPERHPSSSSTSSSASFSSSSIFPTLNSISLVIPTSISTTSSSSSLGVLSTITTTTTTTSTTSLASNNNTNSGALSYPVEAAVNDNSLLKSILTAPIVNSSIPLPIASMSLAQTLQSLRTVIPGGNVATAISSASTMATNSTTSQRRGALTLQTISSLNSQSSSRPSATKTTNEAKRLRQQQRRQALALAKKNEAAVKKTADNEGDGGISTFELNTDFASSTPQRPLRAPRPPRPPRVRPPRKKKEKVAIIESLSSEKGVSVVRTAEEIVAQMIKNASQALHESTSAVVPVHSASLTPQTPKPKSKFKSKSKKAPVADAAVVYKGVVKSTKSLPLVTFADNINSDITTTSFISATNSTAIDKTESNCQMRSFPTSLTTKPNNLKKKAPTAKSIAAAAKAKATRAANAAAKTKAAALVLASAATDSAAVPNDTTSETILKTTETSVESKGTVAKTSKIPAKPRIRKNPQPQKVLRDFELGGSNLQEMLLMPMVKNCEIIKSSSSSLFTTSPFSSTFSSVIKSTMSNIGQSNNFQIVDNLGSTSSYAFKISQQTLKTSNSAKEIEQSTSVSPEIAAAETYTFTE